MAMEKLILKSVMYGVDKIPDSWFDKVPGGFYKAEQKAKAEAEKEAAKGDSKKPRRYSHHQDGRRRTRRDRYEEGRRADDSRRQDRRGRSSYDGNHDEGSGRDDRREAGDGRRRRRRHSVDSDRYGYTDGHGGSTNAYYGDRKNCGAQQARPSDPYFDERQRPMTSDSNRSATFAPPPKATTFAGVAAAEAPYPQTRPASDIDQTSMPSPYVQSAQMKPTEPPRTGSTPNGYVPYAHLYGRSDAGPSPTFAPPPTAASGFKASPTQQKYAQNPFAQQAPTAADAGAGSEYTGQPVFSSQPAWPGMSARAFAGYENTPPYPQTPEAGRATDRYSPSRASHDKRDSDSRRTRSERRPDKKGNGDRGKGTYVDPHAPLNGQIPPPPPGPPPATKDSRRDSGYERDNRRSYRHNDRGYTSN